MTKRPLAREIMIHVGCTPEQVDQIAKLLLANGYIAMARQLERK